MLRRACFLWCSGRHPPPLPLYYEWENLEHLQRKRSSEGSMMTKVDGASPRLTPVWYMFVHVSVRLRHSTYSSSTLLTAREHPQWLILIVSSCNKAQNFHFGLYLSTEWLPESQRVCSGCTPVFGSSPQLGCKIHRSKNSLFTRSLWARSICASGNCLILFSRETTTLQKG